VAEVEKYSSAAVTFNKVADRVMRQYQDALNTEFDTNGHDPFDSMFTNPDEPETGVPDRFDPDRFYRREIRPVLTREQRDAMLKQGLRDVDYRAIDRLVTQNVFERPLGEGKSTSASDLAKELRVAVDESVALDREFIRRNFSLQTIIGTLRDRWQQRLQEHAGRRNALIELSKRFTAFFGIEPKENMGVIELAASGADFVAQMGASLASRCKPYWQSDKDKTQRHGVSLFLPHWGSNELDDRKDELAETIRNQLNDPTMIVDVNASTGTGANPFVMLAYSVATADNIDQIRSLDYWKELPDVKRMLELCESKQGKSLFDPSTNGVGFTDPMYVHHEQLSEMRWRPWYTGKEEERERAALAIDALIYGMLQPNEELAPALAKLGWKLPMLDVGPTSVTLNRPAYLWENGKRRDDPQCPWDQGALLGKSLAKAHELLDGAINGQPHPDMEKGVQVRDGILAEAERFWTQVAPKIGVGSGSDGRIALLHYQQELLSARKKSAKGANKEILSRMIARLADKLV
jgi:hypothetical protein